MGEGAGRPPVAQPPDKIRVLEPKSREVEVQKEKMAIQSKGSAVDRPAARPTRPGSSSQRYTASRASARRHQTDAHQGLAEKAV